MDTLENLRAKLAARQCQPGYAENCRDIEAAIAEMEKANAAPENGPAAQG